MASASVKLTPAPQAQRGWGPLPCPCCGAEEAGITVSLADGGLYCPECETEFSVDDVRELIRRWTPVLAWLETMPG